MPAANPTGIRLPSLLYNPRTRVGGEFYLYYNLGVAHHHGAIGIGVGAVEQWKADAICGAGTVPPVDGFGAIRAISPLNNTAASTWKSAAAATDYATLPIRAPQDQASEFGEVPDPIVTADLTVTGAVAGDSAELITLPDPDNDILICYDQGLGFDVGAEDRPIPRKFTVVDHYVRQRPSRTINLGELYTCNIQGLASIHRRTVTLIGKFFPDGGAVASEIIYFTQVRLSVPQDVPADANESVQVKATGSYRERLVFTAPAA